MVPSRPMDDGWVEGGESGGAGSEAPEGPLGQDPALTGFTAVDGRH